MLNVIMLIVVMFSVIMLNAMAPLKELLWDKRSSLFAHLEVAKKVF